jgi:hypothetical protein
MFCPSCGFEYTHKTNYCKRCGESLSMTSAVDSAKIERPKLAAMFWAVAAFGIIGMLAVFILYNILSERGLRGDELILPFMVGMMFTGAIAGALIWQLSRMITAYQKTERNVVVEKHYIRESPPAQLGAPTDPIQQAVEPPSVIEHTTRQFAGKHK